LMNRLLFHSGLKTRYAYVNKRFAAETKNIDPDLIWIFKGMEIWPSTLEWARRKKIKLVNYNPDNPFLFTGKGSGNSNVTKSIPLYDLHFTYNLSVQHRLQSEFAMQTAFLPFGYELDDKLYTDCQQESEVPGVCFLGNPDRNRATFLQSLAHAGIDLCLYGHGWKKYLDHPRISIFDPAYGDDQWKTLRKYRVQLNLMRIHNEDSHNMRTFEVPAVGGIMLAPDTPEHRLFFENRKEVFLFESLQDCITQIRNLLSLTAERVTTIRQDARSRSVQSGYSYRQRAADALSELRRLAL
jgi:spore maturation protein CgeB